MATVDQLRAISASHGARLLNLPWKSSALIAAWFGPPKPEDTVVVVAGGNSDDPLVNLQQALSDAEKIHHSPEKPGNVTTVAFASTATNHPDIWDEFGEFVASLTAGLNLENEREMGGEVIYGTCPAFPFNLVVVPLNSSQPLAHVLGFEEELDEPDGYSRAPLRAVISPTANDPGKDYIFRMLSARVGLIRTDPSWPEDPDAWRKITSAVNISRTLRGLELTARSASSIAVEKTIHANNLWLCQGIPKDDIVVGAYPQGTRRLPTHAILKTRITTGFELLAYRDEDFCLERIEDLRNSGIGVIVFDDINPPPEFVTALKRQLQQDTGLPVWTQDNPYNPPPSGPKLRLVHDTGGKVRGRRDRKNPRRR